MLQYIKFKDYKHAKLLINLWNVEFRRRFHIDKATYKEKILEDKNLNKEASFVALYDNEPVGFIFIKNRLNESGFEAESDTAFISLIYVSEEMRHMGIGSDLLKLAISEIKKHHNIKLLKVGNEINNLFPGLPNEFTDAPIFFMNKDFRQTEGVVDMIRIIRITGLEEYEDNVHVFIATEDDKEKLLRFCLDNNFTREGYLLSQYFEAEGTGKDLIVARKDGIIHGIAKIKADFKKEFFVKENKQGFVEFFIHDDKLSNEQIVTFAKQTKNYLIKRGCKQIVVQAIKDIKFFKELGYSAYKYYLEFELDI